MSSDNKRALLAVVISGVILFAWQIFFTPKQAAKSNIETVQSSPVTVSPANNEGKTPSLTNSPQVAAPTPAINLVNFELENNGHKVTLNNAFEIIDISNPINSYLFSEIINDVPEAFSLYLTKSSANNFQKPIFNFIKTSSFKLEGTDQNGIKGEVTLDEMGRLQFTLTSTEDFKIQYKFISKEKKVEGNHLREFSLLSKELVKKAIGKDTVADESIKWQGVDFNFHLFAVVNKEKSQAQYQIFPEGKFDITYKDSFKTYSGFFVYTKKDYDHLAKLGDNLNLSVDFGMWSIISVPILRGLQFFYKYIPNYGIAIIILTLIIRLLTFPLQYKSMKSMKKMQEIQPEIAKIRERYKDEPQKLQKETMDLFKKSGANPLSGCLPLLLQMPFFFAFYNVLNNSVELIGAPFFYWIKDLSHKDPFYVLPILMGITMFIQQKMTPSPSMDQTQQKIMMFMPIVFALIMKDLPSGLTLYFFVSTLLGIIQQKLVTKYS